MNENREVPIGARRVAPERRQNEYLVHRIVVRAEKTFAGVERTSNHSAETILQQLAVPGFAKAPCLRYKEFRPFNFEREPMQMARCISAGLLLDRYGVEVEPGGFYSPAPYWWLLVTAPRADTLVNPQHLLLCLESLRTSTTEELILCFRLIDRYRGKVKFRWWLEIIITCFVNYLRIRLLDEWIHTFEEPLQVMALDTWVRANVDNQALPRSVWQDLVAIQGRTPRVCLPPDNGPGRDIVYLCNLRPNLVECILYETLISCKLKVTLLCHAPLT